MSKATMRKPSWLLASFGAALAALANAAPPERVEIEYEVLRNGKTVAEVVERLERGDGTYQLTESWKGRGAYAVLGRARRSSEGSFDANGPRPREYVDERSGRDTQRVWLDWNANTITRRYKGATRTEPVPADARTVFRSCSRSACCRRPGRKSPSTSRTGAACHGISTGTMVGSAWPRQRANSTR